jgi:septal ring-binding cell division protein DamX
MPVQPKKTIQPKPERCSAAFTAFPAFAAACVAVWFCGCAGVGPGQEERAQEASAPAKETHAADAGVPASNRNFEPPGELDKVLDAKPIALAAVKPASQGQPAASAAKAPEPAKGKGNFRIQIGAESDVDAAQAKKAQYEKLLGGSVDMIFDAPYYKLRWGSFENKQDAEDKILELSDLKIQGFVVKQ